MIGRPGEMPRLGICGRGPLPPSLVIVLAVVRKWCTIHQLTSDPSEVVDAVLAVGPDQVPSWTTGPLAVWVEAVEDLSRTETARAVVLLASDEHVVGRAGDRGLLVSARAPEHTAGWADAVPVDAVPVAPFVRSRLRAARGLPDALVIEHRGRHWVQIGRRVGFDSDLGTTAIACASSAVVTGMPLIGALAWGTPCVTDRETVARFGPRPDREVLTADSVEGRRRAAESVAADPLLAARLSWAGRSFVEIHHSPALVAAKLVRRLGLSAASRHLVPGPLATALSDLGTPAAATIVERVRLASASLHGAGD